MREPKFKIFSMFLISIIVAIILLSNVGQNFKATIFSYGNVSRFSNILKVYSDRSKNYQNYINLSSKYIATILRNNHFEPLINQKYIDSWNSYLPSLKYTSTMEVYDNRNKLVQKYNYGHDFIEDFRGNITSGIVKGNAIYEEDINSINGVLNEVLLFNGYKSLSSNSEISELDLKLKSLGASAVISPSAANNMEVESGLYSKDLAPSKKGLAKFITTKAVFNQLIYYSDLGYIIKVKSGAELDPVVFKNVYGIMKGKTPSFKPLTIGVFYDGLYKTDGKKISISKNFTIPSSIMLECLRVINKQRLRRPDRDIIIAFLSGYPQRLRGLDELLTNNIKGDIVILNGLGADNDYSLGYSKSSVNLSRSARMFLNKADYNISQTSRITDIDNNLLVISSKNIDNLQGSSLMDYERISRAGRFILSFIDDECYHLNLISGNIRQFRLFRRFIRDNSAVLSLVVIVILIVVVFLPSRRRKSS